MNLYVAEPTRPSSLTQPPRYTWCPRPKPTRRCIFFPELSATGLFHDACCSRSAALEIELVHSAFGVPWWSCVHSEEGFARRLRIMYQTVSQPCHRHCRAPPCPWSTTRHGIVIICARVCKSVTPNCASCRREFLLRDSSENELHLLLLDCTRISLRAGFPRSTNMHTTGGEDDDDDGGGGGFGGCQCMDNEEHYYYHHYYYHDEGGGGNRGLGMKPKESQ